MPPNCQHFFIWNRFMWCRSVWAYGVMILGVISGVTSWWPPLPSCRASNRLHSISGWFNVGLGWLDHAYSSHSFHSRCSHRRSAGKHFNFLLFRWTCTYLDKRQHPCLVWISIKLMHFCLMQIHAHEKVFLSMNHLGNKLGLLLLHMREAGC